MLIRQRSFPQRSRRWSNGSARPRVRWAQRIWRSLLECWYGPVRGSSTTPLRAS